jgi:hypothetical protein
LAGLSPDVPCAPESDVTERLGSWKEVAGYLKRSVATVQRWEKTEGLPVHRHHHNKSGSVYAYRSELEDWRNSRRARKRSTAAFPVPSHWRIAWAVVLVLGSTLAVAILLFN